VKTTSLRIIAALCLLVCLCSCARPPAKSRPLIFTDPQTEALAKHLQSKLRTNPADVQTRMELGKIYLSEYMLQKAIAEFETVLKIDPNQIQAYLLLSLTIQKYPDPNLSRAARLLENAAVVAPHNADVHWELAQIYDELNEAEKAITEFKKTVQLSNDPASSVSAHLGLMAIYKRQGKSQEAQDEYDAAYEIYPAIEEMIKRTKIYSITPPPKYTGEGYGDGESGFHPSLETRIRQAREEIARISGGKNE